MFKEYEKFKKVGPALYDPPQLSTFPGLFAAPLEVWFIIIIIIIIIIIFIIYLFIIIIIIRIINIWLFIIFFRSK